MLETTARDDHRPRMADTLSEAPVSAGESVPQLPVLDRLRASAERLEAAQGVMADGGPATAGL